MKLARNVLIVALLAAVAAPAFAQEKKQPRQGRRGRDTRSIVERLSFLDLTADQKKKLEVLQADYTKKSAGLREKLQAIYTDEYREAMRKAFREAREKGLTGDDLRKAIQGAGNLTDEQRAQLKEARDMRAAFEKSVDGVLTDEQKAERQKRQRGRRQRGQRRRPGTKQPDA